MRKSVLFAALAVSLCAAPLAFAQSNQNVFPVQRGTASPPPPAAPTGQSAPPEGASAAGIDFGQWRHAEPETYGRQLQTQLRTRYGGQERGAIKTDLEANGFACADGQNNLLHCRIEIADGPCALDWYAVQERPGADLIVGFDRMCLGAR